MESANKTAVLPHMFSYFNQELGLSIEAPGGWEAGKSDDFMLMLIGPSEKNYRTNLGFNARYLEPASQAELERIIRAAQKEQEADLADYRLNRDLTFMLDNRPAFMRFYEWKDANLGLHFSQLQAIVLVGESTVYTIDGSTIKELEEKKEQLINKLKSN